MCGIAGMFDSRGIDEGLRQVLEDMQRALGRRGPDQKGIYIDGPVALAHTRLSVVDPENGRQPMSFARGGEQYVLVYNGELYNTGELRGLLTALGHSFCGHSDTEVLLHAYAEWREDCVERFNGIFAFAVWEKKARRLFFARDRIGVKPFFYTYRNGAFIFGSELKALLAHPDVEATIDTDAIAELMLIGPGRTPGYGVFGGINEMEPGCCGAADGDGMRLWRYWELSDREHTETFEETAEHVRWLVVDSIERQLVSDVPVCTFLSGGLDSSIISSVANSYFGIRGRALHTFSVDYRDNENYFKASRFQPGSDAEYIECMNGYLGAEHHRVLLDTAELADALYDAVDARDLPGMADIDASLLLFCREVKKRATVVLSGECADETVLTG